MSRFDVFLTLASLLALGASPAHGQVIVSVLDASAVEGNPPFRAQIQFPVTLSAPAPAGASVRMATTWGTATSPLDFEGFPTSLFPIPTGATSFSIPVELFEDYLPEPDESFTLTLLSAENLVIGRAAATGTIINDDPTLPDVTISIGDASIVEGGDREQVHLRLPITLSGPTPVTVTVNCVVAFGTTNNRDFHPPLITNGFPPFATEAFLDVTVFGDDVLEPDETFTVTLTDPVNATIGSPATATGTILNDDTLDRTISIGDASVIEGDTDDFRNQTLLRFPLTLSRPAPQSGVSVRATPVAGSATFAVDFWPQDKIVSFAPGSLSRTVDVRIVGELLVEPDETFTVVLSDPIRAHLADDTATGTILNDDVSLVVTVGDATVVEGDDPTEDVRLRFPLMLSRPSTNSGTNVRVTTHAGTATPGTDFEPLDDYVVFPTGTLEAFAEIPIHEDGRFEAGEMFTVSLSPGFRTILGEPSTATGTILNDDDDVTVSVLGDAAIEEGGAAGFLRMLRFPLALDRPSSKDVRVVFDTVDGTATAPDDYLRLYSSAGVSEHVAIIPAGQTQGFAEVGIYQDNEIEPDESFTIELDPEAMQVGTGSATGTILNDDAPGVPALGAGGALVLAGALLAAARRRARGPVGSAARR